jgi:hypothetical protein
LGSIFDNLETTTKQIPPGSSKAVLRGEGAMTYFPEEVVEHIFSFLPAQRDRNAVSLVCKVWYEVERLSRRDVFVGNCYAVRPERVVLRFPNVRALSVKKELIRQDRKQQDRPFKECRGQTGEIAIMSGLGATKSVATIRRSPFGDHSKFQLELAS